MNEPRKPESSSIKAAIRRAEIAIIGSMEPLHVSETDLVTDIASILKRVETGAEVIVERDMQPVAIIRGPEPVQRKLSECIALMPDDSPGTIDSDFAKDVQAGITSHREALEPRWD